MRQQILDGADVASVTSRPGALFQDPFGDADARAIALANQAGYVPVRWTVDALGWEGTAGKISASVVVSGCWAGQARRDRPLRVDPTPTTTPPSTPTRCPR